MTPLKASSTCLCNTTDQPAPLPREQIPTPLSEPCAVFLSAPTGVPGRTVARKHRAQTRDGWVALGVSSRELTAVGSEPGRGDSGPLRPAAWCPEPFLLYCPLGFSEAGTGYQAPAGN